MAQQQHSDLRFEGTGSNLGWTPAILTNVFLFSSVIRGKFLQQATVTNTFLLHDHPTVSYLQLLNDLSRW